MPPCLVDHHEVAPVALRQDQAFMLKRRLKAAPTIGTIPTIADGVPAPRECRGRDAGPVPPAPCVGAYLIGPSRWFVTGSSPKCNSSSRLIFLSRSLKNGKRFCRQGVLVDPAPCDMHVLVAVVFIGMERNRARLAGQPEHPLDPVGGILPLLAGQRFAFAVPHLNMEERLLAFRGPGHDLHVAESVLDVGRREAAKLPQFGAFALLAVVM